MWHAAFLIEISFCWKYRELIGRLIKRDTRHGTTLQIELGRTFGNSSVTYFETVRIEIGCRYIAQQVFAKRSEVILL